MEETGIINPAIEAVTINECFCKTPAYTYNRICRRFLCRKIYKIPCDPDSHMKNLTGPSLGLFLPSAASIPYYLILISLTNYANCISSSSISFASSIDKSG